MASNEPNRSNIDDDISMLIKNNNLLGPDGELTDDALRYLPPLNSQQRYDNNEEVKQKEKEKTELSERLNLATAAFVTHDEIEKFRQRWYQILDGYANDLEDITSVNGFTPNGLATARELLQSLILLQTQLDIEVQQLRDKLGYRFFEQIQSVYTEIAEIIQNLISEAKKVLNQTLDDFDHELENESRNAKKKPSRLMRGGKMFRRIGYLTTILPILLPILCICIAGLILLAAISSLTGGGPDQTKNMEAVQEECSTVVECNRVYINKVKERIEEPR